MSSIVPQTAEEKRKALTKLRQKEGKELAKLLFASNYGILRESILDGTLDKDDYGPAIEVAFERAIETAAKFDAVWKRKKGLFIVEETKE